MSGGLTRRVVVASGVVLVIVTAAFTVLLVAIEDMRESARQADHSQSELTAAAGLERRVVERLREALTPNGASLLALGFPNLGRTDLAEMLWALARSGYRFERWLGEPLARLQALQAEGGRWRRAYRTPHSLDVPQRDRGGLGLPSRWITLRSVVAMYAYAVEAGLPRLFPQKPVSRKP